MTYANALIDRWKKKRNIESDNQAALALGVAKQAVSKWRNDQASPEVTTIEKMAVDLGLNPIAAVANVNAERGSNEEVKAFWGRVARSISMLCLAVYVANSTGALPSFFAESNRPNTVYYVK